MCPMTGIIMSARQSIDILMQAAEVNKQNPIRKGNLLHFPADGELIISADLHNHRRNFERIVTFAALEQFPQRHVILQELIHGGALGPDGEDTSIEMILDAADWALQFPGQVHFLLANHDVAQVTSMPILKDGYDLTDRFTRSFNAFYGAQGVNVLAAYKQFVYSMPLAGITASGIFLSHSLPGVRDLDDFDPSIVRRKLTMTDYLRGGSVYKMVWGRFQTSDLLAQLSKLWWSDLFICGHQGQDTGHGTLGKNMLIVDSSHNHGTILPLVLNRQYTMEDLIKALIPLSSLP